MTARPSGCSSTGRRWPAGAQTGAIATSASPLRFGGNSIWGEYFNGRIDEVRVYNRALTATEIQTDMNTGIGGGSPPPPPPPPPPQDTEAPSAPAGLTASGGVGAVSLAWVASTDNVAVTAYNVHRSTSPGFTPSVANRVGQPASNGFADSGLAAGTYYYRVTAQDAAGNVSSASNEATAVVTAPPPPPPPPPPPAGGLVGAWSFNEGSGSTAGDVSGSANHGSLTNATWSTAGRFGGALSFNGSNALVTVPDAPSLDLTAGMTLEAWVNPAAAMGTTWRTAVLKERPGDLVYSLYASTNTNRPNGQVVVGTLERTVTGTAAVAANTWTHLATTYDGTTQRLFVNGVQVASRAQTGAYRHVGEPTALRGQLRVGRVLQRSDRRGAHLQPGADRHRDPDRHEHGHRLGSTGSGAGVHGEVGTARFCRPHRGRSTPLLPVDRLMAPRIPDRRRSNRD